MTTGQGGAVVTNDPQLHERMRLLRDFGRASGGTDDYESVGWNFKFTDLQAVLGITQMRQLAARITRKREVFDLYRTQLQDVGEIAFPTTDLTNTVPWFNDVLVVDGERFQLAEHLARRDIGTRPFYPALHTTPAFLASGDFPIASEVARRGLWLPSSLHLSNDDVEQVCSAIREYFR